MRRAIFTGLLGASLAIGSAVPAQEHGACPPQPKGCKQEHAEHHGRKGSHAHGGSPAHGDTTFAALQARGKVAMGVDQYTSTHLFDALPDGGRIELQRDEDDPAGVAEIRSHLREIAAAFARGDFRTPSFVHAMGEVPGTAVMAAKKEAITYTVRELPRGGEVRITTRDPQALEAIREFMAFQRSDHRAGGRAH